MFSVECGEENAATTGVSKSLQCLRCFRKHFHSTHHHVCQAVPQLWRLATGFLPRRPGCDPWSHHVGIVAGEVASGRVFF
jgi:hypothetical protein